MATNAPATTYVLNISIVLAFCTFGWVVIFLPAWYWYLIPAAAIAPTVVILTGRWIRHRRLKAELRSTLEQLG